MVATVLALGAGFALKSQCTYHAWTDGYEFRHYCYSDARPLFSDRGLDEDRVPYVEEVWEYPVGIGAFAFGVAKATTNRVDYMNVSFLLLSIAGALIALGLWKLGLSWPRVLLGAAGPTVVVHGLTNWDLLAVALAVWGMLAWRRGRSFESALLFGLGGSTKIFPAFFLPFLLIAAVRARDSGEVRKVVGGSVLGLLLPNAALALRAPEGWWAIWTFQGGRAPSLETPWESFVRFYGEGLFPGLDWGAGWTQFVAIAGAVLLAATLLVLLWRQWRVRIDPLVAGALLTLVFLLTSRIYSPQFSLWVVPLLAAFGAPWVPFVAFVVVDLAHLFVLYQFFVPPEGVSAGFDRTWLPLDRLLVDARWLLLAWCTLAIARAHGIWSRRSRTAASSEPSVRHP